MDMPARESRIFWKESYKTMNTSDKAWFLNRLKAMNIREILWRIQQKGLQKAVLELAYHDFEEKLDTEVKAEEVQFSNHEPYWYFYHVLLSCPGLVKEVSVNNKQVIRTLAEISQNYFPNNLLTTLAANILLVGIALNFKERSNLSFLTFSNVVENLLRNLKNNIEDA